MTHDQIQTSIAALVFGSPPATLKDQLWAELTFKAGGADAMLRHVETWCKAQPNERAARDAVVHAMGELSTVSS